MATGLSKIGFTSRPTKAGRRQYVNADDILVVLERLPEELWSRLRHVYFNDCARGNRVLGYVTRARRDIALCALPDKLSLGRCFHRAASTARDFGGPSRGQWPELAVRRMMLYDVFLHELGHLQIVDLSARRIRRKFASETKAQEFADQWRKRLWSEPFDHDDPVHNPPSETELDQLELRVQALRAASPVRTRTADVARLRKASAL